MFDWFGWKGGESSTMTKNRKRNIEVTPLDRTRVFSLLLACILVMAICLKGSYFPQSYLLILVATAVWMLIRLPSLALPFVWKDLVFVLMGIDLLCYILASFSVAGNHYTAILETLKITTWLLFFLAVRLSQNKIILYRGIVTGCLFLALFGLLAYLGIVEFPQAILWSGRVPRLQSLLQYANAMALFMGIAYFISLYLGHHSQSIIQKQSYYFYGYLFLLTLFLTYSRGGIIVFLVFVWVWVFLQAQSGQGEWWETLRQVVAATIFAFLIAMLISFNRPALAFLVFVFSFGMMFLLWRWKAVPQLNMALVRLALLVPPALIVLSGIGLLVTGQRAIILSRAGTFLERIISMHDAGTILLKYPWLGIGPGSWSSLQFKYQTVQYMVRYLHNGFLQLALDAGLVALLAFLLAVLIYYVRELRSFRTTGDYFELLPGITLGFILLHSLMDIGFSFTGLLLIMAVILGNQPRPDKLDKQKTQIRKLSIYIPKLLLATVLIIIIGVAGYVWNGETLFSQGSDAIRRGNMLQGNELLQESSRYRPGDAEVFLALAQSILFSNQDSKDAICYLEQARRLDPYEPRYVEELINLAYQHHDLAEIYRYSRIFIKLKPLDPQGYLKADWSLQQMYNDREIEQESYEQSKAEVQRALEQSNQTLHPLAKYYLNKSTQQL